MNPRKVKKTLPSDPAIDQSDDLLSQLSSTISSLVQCDMNESALVFSRCISTFEDSASNLYSLAAVYSRMEQHHRALFLIQSHNLHSSDPNALFLLVRIFIKIEEYQDALDALNACSLTLSNKEKAMVSYFKGICFLNLKNADSCKHCMEKALVLDVTLFDALRILIQYHLMPEHQCHHADFYRHLYRVHLSHVSQKVLESQQALDSLFSSEKQLVESRIYYVKQLVSKCRYREALDMANEIKRKDAFNPDLLLVEIDCMYMLKAKNELFILSHELIERFPKDPLSYMAIGCYYLLCERYQEARRYFGKCTTMSPQWGHGWIGFGHSFAGDGEYDQAISAYTTAAKHLPGLAFPLLYIATQYLQINSFTLAEEYLTQARALNSQDPHVENEMGVLYFKTERFEAASKCFETVLSHILGEKEAKSSFWISTWSNLGQSYLKQGYIAPGILLTDLCRIIEKAKTCFETILKIKSLHFPALVGLATIDFLSQKLDTAIARFHEALSVKPDDIYATEMLNACLDQSLANHVGLEPERPAMRPPALGRSRFVSPQKVKQHLESLRKHKPQTASIAQGSVAGGIRSIPLPRDIADAADIDKDRWVPSRLLRNDDEEDIGDGFHEVGSVRKNLMSLLMQAKEQEDSCSDMEMD